MSRRSWSFSSNDPACTAPSPYRAANKPSSILSMARTKSACFMFASIGMSRASTYILAVMLIFMFLLSIQSELASLGVDQQRDAQQHLALARVVVAQLLGAHLEAQLQIGRASC